MPDFVQSEGTFSSWDGTDLFYRQWEPENRDSKKAIILMHRGHEHSGRLNELVEELGFEDSWAFAYDARGHGYSPGPRGYAESFNHLVRDLDAFAKYVCDKHDIDIRDVSVVANSVGAVVTSTWVHDYAPKIRSMVLAAPAFSIKLYVPFALAGLRILNAIRPQSFISSYVKSKMLTHDRVESEKYDNDKLITRDISVNILIELFDTAKRVVQDAGAIVVPTLVLGAGKDWVVRTKVGENFFHGLSSKLKKFVPFKDFYHGIFYEKDRKLAIKEAREFILKSREEITNYEYLSQADTSGYTFNEYESLKEDLPMWKAFFFGMMRWNISAFGWVSKGVTIGQRDGFDSGVSLDHVYSNKAEGKALIGKVIDYFYLNAVGWKGIRIRKRNIEKCLDQAIAEISKSGRTPRIMDIGAGPGRYLLESSKKFQNRNVELLICDNTERNLEAGRKIAEELDVKNVTFRQHDAFSPDSYKDPSFKPNIVVVSGLFELFPDNTMIKTALQGVQEVLDDDGIVIYTGQPWHPQLEMIAHTLSNRDQEQWVMRRRTQAELDQLFSQFANVEKSTQFIDKFGIFTVSISKKRLNVAAIKEKVQNSKKPSAKLA